MMTKLVAGILALVMVAMTLVSVIYGVKLAAAVVVVLAVVLIADAVVAWTNGRRKK